MKKKMSLRDWNRMRHKWVRRGRDIAHDPKCPCGVPEPKPEWRRV
jgi:hypothetical protein